MWLTCSVRASISAVEVTLQAQGEVALEMVLPVTHAPASDKPHKTAQQHGSEPDNASTSTSSATSRSDIDECKGLSRMAGSA